MVDRRGVRRRGSRASGVALLLVGLAWGAAVIFGHQGDDTWPAADLVGPASQTVDAVPGQRLVLWASPDAPDAPGEVPACRATDMVFDQQLILSSPVSLPARRVAGQNWRAVAVLTPGSGEVRISCRGAWQGATVVTGESPDATGNGAVDGAVGGAAGTPRQIATGAGVALLIASGVLLAVGGGRGQRKSINNMSVSVPSEVNRSLS